MEVEVWRIGLGAEVAVDRATVAVPSATDVEFVPIDLDDWSERVLSGHEQARARRLRTADLRRRFVRVHGSLRAILARYLRLAPEAVELVADQGSKPRLSESHPPLRFNLSHSRDLALLAVHRHLEVGVDVEWHDPTTETGRLAARFFGAEEQGYAAQAAEGLNAIAATEARRAEFFRLWTLREAYLKGLGLGLSVPLTGFAVSGPNVVPPRLLRSDYGDPGAWNLASFVPRVGYSAGLAVAQPAAI